MTATTTGSLPRALAAKAVHAVISEGRNLDDALSFHTRQTDEKRDQAMVRALAYGTLRTHLRNQELLGQLLQKPLKRKDAVIESLLSVGLFALTESQRPDYAVVSATVSAADDLGRKHMRGLINAVLRRFLREQDDLLAQLSSVEAATGHPQWLVEQFKKDWPDHWQAIVAAGNRQAPLWVRVNIAHTTPAEWLQQCATQAITASAPQHELPAACLLAEPKPVSELPGFAEGHCSVQDVASQLPAVFLAPEPGMRVLDACAAPGGKTGHLLELCPAAELVAVDAVAERLERVEENLERLGVQASVVCGDALDPSAWWDEVLFDRILVDAPCSATGVIRRHPDIRFLRRPADIPELVTTQLTMLERLWPLLKPGGRLLYSTCSVLKAENEDIVAAFLEGCAEATEVALPDLVGEHALSTAHGLQLLPGSFDNDGFYYALLEKQ